MADYKAPEREIKFALRDVLNVDRLSELEAFADATPDIIDGVIDEAAKFIEGRLLPLREPGDAEGCKVNDGVVTVPEGYPEAYRDFAEAGWVGLSNEPEWGGQGLPYTLAKVVEEMTCSANVAFDLYPGLTSGCYEALQAHASDEQKATYLPKLATGEWTGTMCITEPQAGSDLASIRTKAVKQDDGSYRISGMKIFITSGEHDMVDNIVHYVLARCDDSPEGIKGLST
ncbi:MAG: acyl-CoA dehydrogenase family protein, partial [Candidatus Competibacterales bacterium]|nr:acyl-CoA dehydrogenase family protein [Candidatus Competibacterales bacterium]